MNLYPEWEQWAESYWNEWKYPMNAQVYTHPIPNTQTETRIIYLVFAVAILIYSFKRWLNYFIYRKQMPEYD